MSIKISVIVPVYNVEEYLQECLNSLKEQSENNFEIICINDGSTDNSLKILNENMDIENYKIINQDNKGLSESRNRGLKEARGEYVVFLDSDDLLEKDSIKRLSNLVVKHKPEIVAFDSIIINESGKEIDKNKLSRKDIYSKEILSTKEYIDGMKKKCMMNSTMHCYNREFLKVNNLYFKKGILHEDEEFTMKTLGFVNKVGYIDTPLYLRRIRENSIMTGNLYKNEKSLNSYITVLEIFQQIKKNKEISKEYSNLIDNRSTLLLSNLIRYQACNFKWLKNKSNELNVKLNYPRVIGNVILYRIIKK